MKAEPVSPELFILVPWKPWQIWVIDECVRQSRDGCYMLLDFPPAVALENTVKKHIVRNSALEEVQDFTLI